MASKRNVKYVQQEEPSFLKKFKERVGYKEQANINDKFSDETDNPESESNDNERDIEEEEPVIVVLKQGDLSAEEVSKYKEENCNTGMYAGEYDTACYLWKYLQVYMLKFFVFFCRLLGQQKRQTNI